MIKFQAIILAALALFGASTAAYAETRVTYKSAKTTSSYYQMGVQIAEAMKTGSNGAIIVTVEESQGSVQNVMEAVQRSGNYVFTTPPVLVKCSQIAPGRIVLSDFVQSNLAVPSMAPCTSAFPWGRIPSTISAATPSFSNALTAAGNAPCRVFERIFEFFT